MEKKKLIATAVWTIVLMLLFGAYKIAQYKIDMYYSNIAADQLEDDAAYSKLQTQHTTNTVLLIVFLICALLILIKMLMIWKGKGSDKEADKD